MLHTEGVMCLALSRKAAFVVTGLASDGGLRLKQHHRGASCLAVSDRFGVVCFSTDDGTFELQVCTCIVCIEPEVVGKNTLAGIAPNSIPI